jgi:iron complex transport system substrate-binding protein
MRKLIPTSVAALVCVSLAVTSGLASEYTLKIFGNANMDEVIDEADIEYMRGIIEETNEVTELADANYDGVVNQDDITQIELIIAGEETELTLIDGNDRVVTVPRPIERVVSISPEAIRIMMALREVNKLVAKPLHATQYIFDMYPAAFPESEELPVVEEDNPEFILSVDPDVIFMYSPSSDRADLLQEKTGIPVISHKWLPTWDSTFSTMELVGNVLGNEDDAESLITYCNEKLDEVAETIPMIDENEKPTVFFISRIEGDTILTHAHYDSVGIAGGRLVTKDLPASPQPGGTVWVSVENFIDWNPDIILVARSSETPTTSVEDILSDPRFQTIDAVMNRNVYYTISGFTYWMNDCPRSLIEVLTMANTFYPNEFNGVDIETTGNEIFERFYSVEGYWTELGNKLDLI